MFKKQISPKIVALVFGILILCFVVGFYIFAWTEPTTSPPGGNVAAPLNTSITPQTKEGALTLYDSLSATGFVDFDNTAYFIDPGGGVGGINSPSIKVKGYIQAEGGYKSSDGNSGLTKTIQQVQTGYGPCNLIFENGLLTATTCQ